MSEESDTGKEIKLRVEDLRKTFGEEVAVDDLSIEIEKGTLKSLLGPSGCGKTTTLRSIAGLERPDSGKIWIGDELVCDPENGVHVEPEDRGLGMVFQSYAVWPHMTVEENVMYPLKIQKIGTKQERQQKVDRVLEAVGLDPYKDNLATNLSGGQQQRVAISRALVVEPDILLFDEPLSNLDAKLRREMRMEINRIYHEFDTTVLYVTHSQDEAMFLSDEIAIMRDGKIIEEGPPATLHSDPQTFFGMNFMGRCNTVEGEVTGLEDGVATVRTNVGELRSSNMMSEFGAGEKVFVCFRPKSCRLLTDESDPVADDEVAMDGTLKMRAATRDFTEYQVNVEGSEILVRTPEPLPVYAGDDVRFAIKHEDVKLFAYSDNRGDLAEVAQAVEEDEVSASEIDESDVSSMPVGSDD
ncbi:MAG: ABC transporter ATP-binding protein [Haloferacaceae archaeon]